MKADAKNPFDLLKPPVSSKVNIVRVKPSSDPVVDRPAVDDGAPADITTPTAIINVIPPADVTVSTAAPADVTASTPVSPPVTATVFTADVIAIDTVTPPVSTPASPPVAASVFTADVIAIDTVTPPAATPVYDTGTAGSASQTPPGIAIVRRGDIGASYAATFVSPERSKREADRDGEVLLTPTKKSKVDDRATAQNTPSNESITSPRQALGEVSNNVVNCSIKNIDVYLATPEEDRIHLECPFHDREYAKKMGAIWIPEPIDKWFINRKHKSYKRGWMYW
jgi:hypothetical protein